MSDLAEAPDTVTESPAAAEAFTGDFADFLARPKADEPVEAAAEGEQPAEEEKPDGKVDEAPAKPETVSLKAMRESVEEATLRATELTARVAQFEETIGEYDAALRLMRADNDRLIAFIQENKLLDERDLQLRQYELREAAEREMAAARAEYQRRIAENQQHLALQEQVARYEREIPKALAQYELCSEELLCKAIENLPPGAKEDIPALAKQIHNAILLKAQRHSKAAAPRRAPTSSPQVNAGSPLPSDFESFISRGSRS